ncbi:unnamed protein product [Prorocentrum cordatum]|uniref:Uncharacterized protein n=1 Tax=Prorocentrum cordatum TaxID=2364126 RepID=A0ABN9ST74_9DINO|nr:unnamed protein product [Polarella glacialis]
MGGPRLRHRVPRAAASGERVYTSAARGPAARSAIYLRPAGEEEEEEEGQGGGPGGRARGAPGGPSRGGRRRPRDAAAAAADAPQGGNYWEVFVGRMRETEAPLGAAAPDSAADSAGQSRNSDQGKLSTSPPRETASAPGRGPGPRAPPPRSLSSHGCSPGEPPIRIGRAGALRAELRERRPAHPRFDRRCGGLRRPGPSAGRDAAAGARPGR